MLSISPLNDLSIYLDRLVKGRLWLKVLIGLFLGASLGVGINPANGLVSQSTSAALADWLDLPGQVFMRLVQMIMIPLIFTSIISGIVSNTSDKLKSFGLKLLLYFIATTVVSITIGLVLTLLMNPGKYVYRMGGFRAGENAMQSVERPERIVASVPDAISGLIPNNPLEAILTGEMLGVVIFTIIIGVAVTQLSVEHARPIIRFAEAVQKVCMIVVSWAMTLVPYAVFGLMAALLSRIGLEIFLGLGYYIAVVVLGLLLLIVFYLILVFGFTGMGALRFLTLIKEPQLLAFSTASSAAVMPLSMKTADEKLGVSSNISDFVIPIGATVNMDGTALFQCVTALFLAQSYGLELGTTELLLITATVVGASVGTPSIPGGGVIILASVLGSAGIPADGLVVIIGIDRILGMFRTAVNVTGDLTATVIFNRFYGEKSPSEVHQAKDPLAT